MGRELDGLFVNWWDQKPVGGSDHGMYRSGCSGIGGAAQVFKC